MSQAARSRRARVMAELLDQKQVSVSELATRLVVSEATVRRDLKALAEEHQAELIHGGARLPRDADFSFQAKALRHADDKAVVGQLAAKLVRDGDQIFLDSGTTCFAMAQHLGERRDLGVICNSTRLAAELRHTEVLIIGGRYRPERLDAVGPMAVSALSDLRGYVCFIGADGIGPEAGISASDAESAQLHRTAVANARETVLLVDHSKFQTPSLFRIVGWERIAKVVTDRVPDASWSAFFAERGIPLLHP